MKVIITGGWGFLGSQLTELLLERGGTIRNREDELVPISEIVLFDSVEPEDAGPLTARGAARGIAITSRVGDITNAACCAALVDGDGCCVFHLAGVMSGACEADFDLAWRVNVLGAANLLAACRARGCGIRVVLASTIAAIGEQPSGVAADDSKLRPASTYGMTKAACELLVNDMTRRGFVDGRVARLPTVIVRPGAPNAAATSCFSGIVREPLAAVDVEVPVSKDLRHAVIGLRCCVGGILDIHEVPLKRMEEVCGPDRAVNLPSLSATLGEIEAAMRDVAARNGMPEADLGRIEYKPDEFLSGIVASMASATDFSRALALGLEGNSALTEVVSQYLEDFGVAGSALYKKRHD